MQLHAAFASGYRDSALAWGLEIPQAILRGYRGEAGDLLQRKSLVYRGKPVWAEMASPKRRGHRAPHPSFWGPELDKGQAGSQLHMWAVNRVCWNLDPSFSLK